ncbi:MAG: DUF1697 domain-containing protein [Bacteroidales bacterium]|nr:DUF1697 domain-containing protein [Bacteroidales bacterium]
MQTYISYLRGVNMTGHNSIKMTDLAALYRDLGFLSLKHLFRAEMSSLAPMGKLRFLV